MLRELPTRDDVRTHRRSLSAQSAKAWSRSAGAGLKQVSKTTTPIPEMHDTSFNRPPRNIRVVDSRNRLKPHVREPRCSSVPTPKLQVTKYAFVKRFGGEVVDPPAGKLHKADSWFDSGNSSRLGRLDRARLTIHNLRERFGLSSSPMALIGKAYISSPPCDSEMAEQINPTKMSSQRRFSNVSDFEKVTLPQSTSDRSFYDLHSEIETQDRSSLNRVHFDLEFEDFLPMSESTDGATLMQSIGPVSSPAKFDPSKSIDCIRKAGVTLFNKDPHIGIDYLTQKGILSNDPMKVAEFLTERGLSRQAIGEYFGKVSDPLAVKVTEEFIKRLNFRHVELDVALRRLLEQVHPDGESQKIEFLLSVLKKCYIEQNMEVYERFHDVETIGILAYSIMLLHTTFYNQNARRHGKPMTKIEFINNNRGIDNGNDILTATLEGIYDRVSEKEFRTLADPTDRLRRLDNLFTGPLKPGKLVERHRRYIMRFSALEVLDFSARKPILPRPASQIRCLFIFNDLLVVTKPIGVNRSNVVDDLLPNGGRRIRSIERLARVGSPVPPAQMNAESMIPTPVTQRRLSGSIDMRPHPYYSIDVPPSSPFLVRQIIPLIDVKILHFECEYYKFGVQLCDENSVLISIHLPGQEVREKFTEVLRNAIWETKEVQSFSTEGKQATSPTKRTVFF